MISLVIASLLATFLVYTALFDTSRRVLQIGDVAADPALAAKTVRLNGRVAHGSVQGSAGTEQGMRFVLEDNEHRPGTVRVVYTGSVPDAFREGRAILIDGSLRGGTFVAEPGSLSTKCPSKYEAADGAGGGAT